MGEERHIYPGNNTPEGFFSYYSYILGQKEANRIICIKGGPGVGKSTFMRKIGEEFSAMGEDVDYMHCSSDNGSLDGVVLKNHKIAFIDGTSPHVVDPINPGAVDSIIHLGEFWNEEGIRKNKGELIESNERIKRHFSMAYNYLGGAGKMYDNLAYIYDQAIESAEIYKLAAGIVVEELMHLEICLKPGGIKKYFAGAITPGGLENQLRTLINGCRRVYMIIAPAGVSNERLLNIFAESAVYRGLNVEEYYCPMKPSTKLEHLLIPELGIACISLNKFHDMEPWEVSDSSQVVMIDMNDLIDRSVTERYQNVLDDSLLRMEELLDRGIGCLKAAKREHDILEEFYIPNMDFKKIDTLRNEIIAKIL